MDRLFAAARDAEAPGDALRARVLADAAAVQAAAVTQGAAPAASRPGWLSVLGGWRGLSGLTAAGLAGLAFGIVAPAQVTTWLEAPLGVVAMVDAGYVPSLTELAALSPAGLE